MSDQESTFEVKLTEVSLEDICEYKDPDLDELEEFHQFLEKKMMFQLIKKKLYIDINEMIDYFNEKGIYFNIYYRYFLRFLQVKINDDENQEEKDSKDYISIIFSMKGIPYFSTIYNNKEVWSPGFEGIKNEYLKNLLIDLYEKFLSNEEKDEDPKPWCSNPRKNLKLIEDSN